MASKWLQDDPKITIIANILILSLVLVLVRTPVSAKKQPSGKTDAAQLPKPPQAQCCKVAVEEWIGLRKKTLLPELCFAYWINFVIWGRRGDLIILQIS